MQATVEAAPPPAPRLEHDLDRFRRETPRCREDVGHCFSLALHLVMLEAPDGRVPVQTIDWVAAQVRVAQELYAPIDASFQVDSVDALPGEIVEVNTRSERDALGHGRFSPGAAHVFVVARLGDIDIAGEEIRGVHWRDRADRSRRWVILSRIAADRVLSHELGHFFGLPHSDYPESIMNKSPRADPPWSERGFVAAEYTRMRRHRDRMLASGMLINHAAQR